MALDIFQKNNQKAIGSFHISEYYNIMNDLQADLKHSHNNIVDWLNQYEKVSEEIISLNHTIKLHNILDAISGFDIEKIKSIQHQISDQIVRKHLQQISAKIQQQKNKPEKTSIVETPKPEPPKRQSRIAEKVQTKKDGNKDSGIIGSLMNRFKSKEKKPTEIILPDQEPDCTWDPVRRVYVFAGEEPEAPKQVPKPPPKGQKKVVQQKKQTQMTELDSLTAPPAFKRKGAGGAKPKTKAKQEVFLPPPEQEPMNFAKVLKNIKEQYEQLFEKIRNGCYEKPISQTHLSKDEDLSDFMQVAQKILTASEDIAKEEHRMIQKLSKQLSTSKQNKLMEKLVNQINESSNIYQLINTTLDDARKEVIYKDPEAIRKYSSKKEEQAINSQQLNIYRRQNQRLSLQVEKMIQEKQNLLLQMNNNQHFETLIQQKNQENKHLYEQNCTLENEIQELRRQINESVYKQGHRWQQMQAQLISKEQELKNVIKNNKQEHNELLQKIQQLKTENFTLKNEKIQIENTYRISQANISNNSGKLNQQMERQKLKIQTQLKFYQQKEKNYLTNIKNMEEHNNFIYELEKTLQQQNNLLSSIMQKRLEIGRSIDNQDMLTLKNKQVDLSSPHSVIIELSDIINSITLTHLDRLELFNKKYSNLNKKYQESKQLVKKIKNNASNENISLNRSVTRLKSLIETYKNAKEESEQRCKLLQLQIEKLKKKLEHYKEEDKFNKSYLLKLKPPKSPNQNDSIVSMQEDNEQLAQTIEDLQNDLGMKNENNIKLQKDLEDILVLYEKLQGRLTQIEKKSRESEKTADLMKEEKQQLLNKINLLEVKLANQKQKNDDLTKNFNNRIKKTEDTWEKKCKILKEDLQRAQEAEEELKSQLRKQKEASHDKMKQIERSYQDKEQQYEKLLSQKESQNSELLILVDDFNIKIEEKDSQISQLSRENTSLKAKEEELAISMHEYNKSQIQTLRQSQQMHNSMIHSLLAQYKQFQEQESSFRNDYEEKIGYLSQQLLQSNQQSEQLVSDLNQYSHLVGKLDEKLQLLQEQNQKTKQQLKQSIHKLEQQNSQLTELVTALEEEIENNKQTKVDSSLSKLQQENNQLSQLVTALQEELESKKKQAENFQELAQTVSGELSQLKVKNSELKKEKDDINEQMWAIAKQMEVKEDQINNKSESLLIKSEELEEKNQIMMDRQQNFVLTKEELEGLKNEIKQKECKVTELNSDLEIMAKQLEELTLKCQELQNEQKKTTQLNISLQGQIAKLKEQTTTKDIDIDADEKQKQVEGQIEYLLKQIQSREGQVTQLKQENSLLIADIEKLKRQITQSKTIDLEKDQKQKQVQGQIQYLLKQIQSRQNQIDRLKQQNTQLSAQIYELKNNNKSLDIEQDSKQKEVEGQIQYLLKQIQGKQEQIDQLKQQIHQIKSKKAQQKAQEDSEVAQRQKQVEGEMEYLLKEIDAKDNKISELKDKIQFFEGLVNEKTYLIETQNKNINQLQSQNMKLKDNIQEFTNQIERLHNNTGDKTSEISEALIKLQGQLKIKQRELTDMEINKQETQRLLFVAQNENKQQKNLIIDLENKIGELTELLQAQEDAINKQTQGEDNQMVKTLREVIQTKSNEVRQTKKDLQELSKTLVSKSFDYENKIESLEREISTFSALKSANRKLEQNVKALELENASLLDEKVELMRSNDNLVKINQKLIIELSPHTKMSQKQHPHPKGEKNAPKKQQIKEPQKKESKQDKEDKSPIDDKNNDKKKAEKQEKKDEKDNKQIQMEKKSSGGFMNTLSSWFLTPTQSERLTK